MIKAFKLIPEPLQKLILRRLGWGAAVFVLSIALFIYTMEIYSVLFCVAIVIFSIVSSFMLFRLAVIGDYLVISGECLGITVTPIKRQIKMITMRTDDNQTLKVMIRQRTKRINVGSKIMLYVASNVSVGESGGAHLLHTYLALDTIGGG